LISFSIHETNIKEFIFQIFQHQNKNSFLFSKIIDENPLDKTILKYLKLEASWILINLFTCNSYELKIIINGVDEKKNPIVGQKSK
jgi:hypothetical protein